jgi:hypothetical protein
MSLVKWTVRSEHICSVIRIAEPECIQILVYTMCDESTSILFDRVCKNAQKFNVRDFDNVISAKNKIRNFILKVFYKFTVLEEFLHSKSYTIPPVKRGVYCGPPSSSSLLELCIFMRVPSNRLESHSEHERS